jgi:hypothetical protein
MNENSNPYQASIAPQASSSSPYDPSPWVRFSSALISISGVVAGLSCWVLFPVFALGYVLWFGWIAIAFGSAKINRTWFWVPSFLWNAGMVAVFFFGTNEYGSTTRIYYYAITHSLAASLFSLIGLVVLIKQKRDGIE